MGYDEVFRPSFGNRPDKIIGRNKALREFSEGLSSQPGSRDRAILITGQRGIGKTALLLELTDMAKDAGFVVARVVADDDMLNHIIESIQIHGSQFVPDQPKKVVGANAGAFSFSFGLTFSREAKAQLSFPSKMLLLCQELAKHGKGVLILVDEVQANSPAMRTLATTYQQLVGDDCNIAITMAGLPSSLSKVLNDKVLTFLNRARKITLKPIHLGEVKAYYASVFSGHGRSIDEDVLDYVVAETKGHPYLLQLIGYYLMKYSAAGGEITREFAQAAIESSKEDLVETVFLPALQPLSAADMDFLIAMAWYDGPSKITDIERALKKSNNYVQQYRRRLIDQGIIASPRRGEVEIIVPFLRDYICQEYFD